jgi:hypothetical protein
MSYGQYRNTGIRRLHSYAEALAKFNDTKPIRGRTDITRPMYPLGHRHRVDSFWMQKCPLTQDVELFLYRTPVVSYKPDGRIAIKSDGWDTVSTAQFIVEVTGMQSYIYDRNLCVSIWTQEGCENYRVPANGTLTFVKDNGQFKYVDGAPTAYTHKVNRKAINQKRKQYKEFKQYALAMLKLRDGQFSKEEREAVGLGGGYVPDGITHINGYTWAYDQFAKTVPIVQQWMLADHEEKHNDYYKAFIVFAASFGTHGSITRDAFDAGFNYFILGLHRDEVMDIEVVPLGQVKKDNYGKYFRRGWGKYYEGANKC